MYPWRCYHDVCGLCMVKDSDSKPYEGFDSFLFQYHMFVQQLDKVIEGKWRLSLSDRHMYYSHATVPDS